MGLIIVQHTQRPAVIHVERRTALCDWLDMIYARLTFAGDTTIADDASIMVALESGAPRRQPPRIAVNLSSLLLHAITGARNEKSRSIRIGGSFHPQLGRSSVNTPGFDKGQEPKRYMLIGFLGVTATLARLGCHLTGRHQPGFRSTGIASPPMVTVTLWSMPLTPTG